MIRLVVNADDLGLHPRIDEGILEASRNGIVTSTTVLVTAPNADRAVAAAKAQGLGIGVHLSLCTFLPSAAPAEEVPSLVRSGRLRESWSSFVAAFAAGRIRLRDVRTELIAQVDRARQLGFEPDHLDGHQHLHVLPGIRSIVESLATERGLPVRWPRERFTAALLARPAALAKSAVLRALSVGARGGLPGIGHAHAGELLERPLRTLLEALPDGDWELGCHPGRRPDGVPEQPDWTYGWEGELAALCADSVRAVIQRRSIELTTYGALARSTHAET